MCKCGCESKGCYENYFVIYKGDDTDFIEGQSLVVEISTDIDLDGSTATFSFLGFSQTFDPIPSDKKLNIIIPHSETAKFPVGMVEATVTITNSSSKIRTVSNTIPIKVTQSVDEAYSPDNPNAISVTLSNGETGRLNAALDDIELLKKNKADKTDLEAYAKKEVVNVALDGKVSKEAFGAFDGIAVPSASLSSLKKAVLSILAVLKGLKS